MHHKCDKDHRDSHQARAYGWRGQGSKGSIKDIKLLYF